RPRPPHRAPGRPGGGGGGPRAPGRPGGGGPAPRPPRLTPLPAGWLPAVLDLPDPAFRVLGGRMRAIEPLARSSMSDDLASGRATEVEWINGEVVRLAAHFGGQAPVNARLCALVHDAERAAARPAWRGDALWAELTAQAPHTGNVRAA
ncbi:ketopantoate reductase C-terminal domain-containing protein, partial [Burkholderia contaminans]|uniref:ketopantoate reductase C-terminal domain-containing protein n=1 Tax=Burkholderia contaminans TaxID=488447 RepID=UPI0028F42E10